MEVKEWKRLIIYVTDNVTDGSPVGVAAGGVPAGGFKVNPIRRNISLRQSGKVIIIAGVY